MRTKQKKVTLGDIADALGVSKGTVSMAMNGSTLVAATTREKVLNKIAEMGYVYNRGAASLATGMTRTIGIAVHNITNPYFAEVCAAMEAELSLNERMAFLCNTDESLDKQTRFIRALTEQNADGLLLCPAADTTAADLQPFLQSHYPIVLLARDIAGVELDFIGNDDQQAMYLATQHLIELGHQHIAMIGGNGPTSVAHERCAGFMRAMAEAGLTVAEEWLVDAALNAEGGFEAANQLMQLANKPTAIACLTDLVALGTLSALHALQIRPGFDVAVIGCDDIAEGARTYAQLSTVHVKKATIGQKAAETLLHRMEHPSAPIQRIRTPPSLVIRHSTQPNYSI